MSVKLMSLVFDLGKEHVSAVEKSILLAMADNAWDDGTSCYPSRGLMEHKTNLGHSTIDRALRMLKTAGWIEPVGTTSMGVVEWVLNVDALEQYAVPYAPARPYPERVPDVPTVGTTHTQSGQQTTNEPEYIDDVDGVPDELAMEWDTFLKGWSTCYPNKTQPRKTNSKLKAKFKTRMKNADWRKSWKRILWNASKTMPWSHQEGWFKPEWILRNDDNLFKLADGTFDFKNKEGHVPFQMAQQVTDPSTVSRDNWTEPRGGGV